MWHLDWCPITSRATELQASGLEGNVYIQTFILSLEAQRDVLPEAQTTALVAFCPVLFSCIKGVTIVRGNTEYLTRPGYRTNTGLRNELIDPCKDPMRYIFQGSLVKDTFNMGRPNCILASWGLP